jgi:hypothetical protein
LEEHTVSIFQVELLKVGERGRLHRRGKKAEDKTHHRPIGCGMSILPHFLDGWLTDGGEVVWLTCRLPFTPRKGWKETWTVIARVLGGPVRAMLVGSENSSNFRTGGSSCKS